MTSGPLIYCTVGEPSGDALGGCLMAALKRQNPAVRFSGIGGPRMQAEGLRSLFSMDDLSLFGLAEIAPRLPLVLRRLSEAVADVIAARPDVLVTIDAPDFCFRLAARVRKALPDCTIIHYVAPSVWAWRAGRAARMAAIFDMVLTLLPFEPPYFERVGLAARFVGHPLTEAGIDRADPAAFRQRHGLAPDCPLLLVLPGSRRSEIARLMPDFQATIDRLRPVLARSAIIMPTVAGVADAVRAQARLWSVPTLVVEGDEDKYGAMAAGRAALAASGTVALELALAGLSSVCAYRVHPLTYALYRPFIRTKFINLINIIAGESVVAEHVQGACRPDRLAEAMGMLWQEDAVMRAQRGQHLQAIAACLAPPGGLAPSDAAASAIMDCMRGRK
jgi:lipid-A-disaccharide synthase